ncbi:MAG: ribonuclease HII [Candidatus Omnitrophica bacterium]|nr:ribonuclease HII [Candidatus Omnitrophota bacterium]
MLAIEDKTRKAGYRLIIGVDEAGRGPLAGPVVAAAVSLKENKFPVAIRDSKKLSASQREAAFHEIYPRAWVGIGIMNETVIDEVNILNATFFAMHNAVRDLVARLPASCTNDDGFTRSVCLLVDGDRFKSDQPYHYETIVQGDDRVLSIACASIVAKVVRDRILSVYHRVFPQYGFDRHKGYPTMEHKMAIKRFGLSLIHRRSFHYGL